MAAALGGGRGKLWGDAAEATATKAVSRLGGAGLISPKWPRRMARRQAPLAALAVQYRDTLCLGRVGWPSGAKRLAV